MEEPLVGVDCCLGSTDRDTADTKASPSHSSDSGFSDCDPSNAAFMGDFDLLSPVSSCDNENVGTEVSLPDSYDVFDEELSIYLTESDAFDVLGTSCDEKRDECSDAVGSLLKTPQSFSSNFVVQSQTAQDTNVAKSVFKSKTTAFKPIAPVQSPVSSTSSSIVTHKKLPAVKVVKVVKAKPAATNVESTIMEALDERNRKNAVQAKINREKKKVYINGLENDIASLKKENEQLKDLNQKVIEEKSVLQEEIQYLRNVLANQSTLSNMLKNIENVKNVRLTSSFSMRKRSMDHDHDYMKAAKAAKHEQKAGICLHVENEDVSLEFCSQCSRMAHSQDPN